MAEQLIFFGVSAAGNTTVFKSNGTAAGTAPMIDTDLGDSGGIGSELVAPGPVLLDYGKTILAQGYSGTTVLWIYTKPVPPATTGAYTHFDFEPTETPPAFGFVEYKGLVYFNGAVFATGSDLFSTNGTVGRNDSDHHLKSQSYVFGGRLRQAILCRRQRPPNALFLRW